MIKIKVSAPGKLHLLGEHSVVHNRPAILAAVGKRCSIEITLREDGKIKVNSSGFSQEAILTFDQVVEKFDKAQRDWDTYDLNNNISLLKSITQDPLDYPLIVVGQLIKEFNLNSIPGFNLVIDSQIPVGAGMGSSGALAVSVIGALFILLGKELDKDQINKIAYLCEQKKHGKPSGGDNSTSCFGGLVWFKKDEGLRPLKISLSNEVMNNFYIVDTGTPSETTGEMVSMVRGLVERNPESTNKILDDQERLVRDLLPAFESANHGQITEIIKKGEANLEKLGVVSSFAHKIIRDVEVVGGAAKICGGGGIVKSVGIILIYHTDLQKLRKVLKSRKLTPTQLTLGVEGLREEK